MDKKNDTCFAKLRHIRAAPPRVSATWSGTALRNTAYDFSPATGNLNQRRDNIRAIDENFSFDNLNRLTQSSVQLYNPPAMLPDLNMVYAPNGNILQKTDAGTFSYDPANRLSEIEPYADIPEATQTLTYTPYNKVATIDENDIQAAFSYWPDQQRGQMDLVENGVIGKTKYYAPGYEKEVIPSTGTVRELCYITGPDGHIVAISETLNGVEQMFYTLTDHLGSITHILDAGGGLVEERSYNAWGRLRNPDNWVSLPAVSGNITDLGWDRGYTGHEYLPAFGIVNMNGRLYDPVMGRMFSPDPYIIGADNTQGYNRYTYALNNPLKYTDPSGENPLVIAMVAGAAISALSYTANVAFSEGGFNNWNWFQFSYATITGGISGALTFGIGEAFGPVGNIGHELARAGVHSLTGYTTSHGDVGAALASGVGSFGGYLSYNIPVLNTDVGGLAFSSGMGGLTSVISGGKFWEGFLTAGSVHLLNQEMHKLFFDAQLKKMYGVYKKSVENYPTPDEFYKSIGGPLGEWAAESPDEFQNTCAARLSLSLNYGGFEIPDGTPNTYEGGDGKYYFIQAKAMYKYLSKSLWAPPKPINYRSLKNGVFFQTGFSGGVTGHLDILYRGNPAHNIYPTTTYYWH